jgi:hypothetical protein
VSDQTNIVEEIWVNVAEGAEKTGFHPDHVRRLARENSRLPEDQRYIRFRKDSHGYAIWLPDLMSYVKRGIPSDDTDSSHQGIEEIWVSTIEGAQITGYNMDYLRQIAYKMWRLPEGKRDIKVRNRSGRYELWLPDLIDQIKTARRGPNPKRNSKT